MSIQASCPACGGTVQADTKDELLKKVAGHAKDHHGMDEIPAEVVEAVKASIKEV